MTVEKAKEIIEKLYPLQEKKMAFPCPRCGHDRMHVEHPVLNALSRYAEVYICEECGLDEALRDMARKPMPLNEWSLPLSLEENEKGEPHESK